MKKYVCMFIFLFAAAVCSAQQFRAAELVDLTLQGTDAFKQAAQNKGYTYSGVDKGMNNNESNGGMSSDYVYTHAPDFKLTFIAPSFATATKMLAWEFGSASVYEALKNELAKNYMLKNTERRNGGKYVSLYYSRPEFDIILTCDKRAKASGQYTFSVRYTNPTIIK